MAYDEFGMLAENAAEAGLPWAGPPAVRRESVGVAPDQQVSALVWGEGVPGRLVLLHGGAQNAHTWDTVALALRRPLIAVDLPGHGRSSWRADRDYWRVRTPRPSPWPSARWPRGRRRGGHVARRADRHPARGRPPGPGAPPGRGGRNPRRDRRKVRADRGVRAGPGGVRLVRRAAGAHHHASTRPARSALRRGLLHNARPLPDGRWAWRYDRLRPPGGQLDCAACGPTWPR